MKPIVLSKKTRNGRPAVKATAAAATLALALFAAGCGGGSSAASAESASIRITGPTDGATVARQFTLTLDPSIAIGEPSTGRHHVHLYYDGNRSSDQADYDISYDDSFTVTRLGPGRHTIDAVIANADHSLTDVDTAISVTVSDDAIVDTPAATATNSDGY
jgi:hypothetical protein